MIQTTPNAGLALASPSHAAAVAEQLPARLEIPTISRPRYEEPKDPAICPTDDDAVVPKMKMKKTDKQSTEYIIKSGIAGGLAGCAAKTLVGPLDRVKILFQASNPQFAKYTGSSFGVLIAMKDIWHTSGVGGLFRGHSATLLRIFPYAGIKFLAYEQVRSIVIPDRSQETSFRRFMSGSIAGIISVFFTYPLEVIRVRMAFETKASSRSSLADICRRIYHEQPPVRNTEAGPSIARLTSSAVNATSAAALAKTTAEAAATAAQATVPRSGLVNFYRGFSPTLWGMIPYAGMSFLTHDVCGDMLRVSSISQYTTLPGTATAKKPAQLTTWAQLIAGGMAGLVSQTASYPLEVIRRRMQVGGAVGDGRRVGMAETASLIFRERGFRGFFVGLGIGYVKIIPMAATSFYVYERSKWYLGI